MAAASGTAHRAPLPRCCAGSSITMRNGAETTNPGALGPFASNLCLHRPKTCHVIAHPGPREPKRTKEGHQRSGTVLREGARERNPEQRQWRLNAHKIYKTPSSI